MAQEQVTFKQRDVEGFPCEICSQPIRVRESDWKGLINYVFLHPGSGYHFISSKEGVDVYGMEGLVTRLSKWQKEVHEKIEVAEVERHGEGQRI